MKQISGIWSSIKYLFGETEKQRESRRRDFAETLVNVRYESDGIFVVVDSVSLLKVTEETNIKEATIAFYDVTSFIDKVRANYVKKNK